MTSSDDIFVLHRIIRGISGLAASTFFTKVQVVGGEHVPNSGPMIVAATHHNMMLDPVILSSHFPNRRILHYWSKASLFANPIMKWILLSSGNIPVDRKSKDRQKLFQGTFEALSQGHAVALFPEGTSYTEPRIMQVKDGAAWAALEYTKWAKENPEKLKTKEEVMVVPAAIVYTNKSKYRSNVIMEFGKPIKMSSYESQFFSDDPRSAVKRLTKDIETSLVEKTVNAKDWDTLYTARMARDILWVDQDSIHLDHFVEVLQTLVDLFSTPDLIPSSLRRSLLSYYSLLQSTNLTNSVLHSLPLPPSLDPNYRLPVPLPSRLLTLFLFILRSLSSLSRLPFFFLPLLIHLPVYMMGRIGAKFVEEEEETQAQNKVAFGLISMMMVYPVCFLFLWGFFWYSTTGAVVAAGIVGAVGVYHTRMINDNYEHAKRFIAAWRVLIGIWAPKHWELSLAALSQYTTPWVPKENPWIDKGKEKEKTDDEKEKEKNQETKTHVHPMIVPSTVTPSVVHHTEVEPPATTTTGTNGTATRPTMKRTRTQRPSTRRIMRHVLRARVEAVNALAGFFDQLEKETKLAEKGKVKVRASRHLARLYGEEGVGVEGEGEGEGYGWRYASEVVDFLKKRGAKVPQIKSEQGRRHGNGGIGEEEDHDWALSTDAEVD